jgi:hypothetical protein
MWFANEDHIVYFGMVSGMANETSLSHEKSVAIETFMQKGRLNEEDGAVLRLCLA